MLSFLLLYKISLFLFFFSCTVASEFIYPDKIGNVTKYELSSAPACGTILSTYNSIPAYSNGNDQGTGTSCAGSCSTGSQYQCVEYVQRYMNSKHGTEKIWPVSYASQMCSKYPSGIYKVSTPSVGGIVVFNFGTYGHTAIISSISGSTLSVIEQNASPSGVNTYPESEAYCYLQYGSSTSSGCKNKGYYCGGDGLNLSVDTLYYCSAAGATPTVSKQCAFCVTMPSGQDDACSTSGSCSAVTTGYYCGSDKIGGNSNTLYYCKNGEPSGATYCSSGCYTASSGSDDYCK